MQLQEAIFGAGCFWGTEKYFAKEVLKLSKEESGKLGAEVAQL